MLRKTVRIEAFLDGYSEAGEALARHLDRFLKEAGEDEVHDARTATRKVQARIELLPRALRKNRHTRELSDRLERLMKRSAEVRDLDVIRRKLAEGAGAGDPVLGRIDRSRRRLLRNARDAAESAAKLELPAASPDDISQLKLQRRFDKVALKLEGEIEGLRSVVARDPSDLKSLHRLRIDCKKLRYTLDAVASGRASEAKKLEAWQDMLGSIHDWDVAIAFVSREEPESVLLRKWKAERAREFDAFARASA